MGSGNRTSSVVLFAYFKPGSMPPPFRSIISFSFCIYGAFNHRRAAATSVPQPDQRCPLGAKAECGDLRVHVWRGPPPRSADSASTLPPPHTLPGSRDPFAGSAELGSRGQLALLTLPRSALGTRPYRECTSGGRMSAALSVGSGLGGSGSRTRSWAREGP